MKHYFFADDTLLVGADKFSKHSRFQAKLNNIFKWCTVHKSLINESYSQIKKLGRTCDNNIFLIGKYSLEVVSVFKYLELISKINWKVTIRLTQCWKNLSKFNELWFRARSVFSYSSLIIFYIRTYKNHKDLLLGFMSYGATSKIFLNRIHLMK